MNNVIQTAFNSRNFKTLIKVLREAGLIECLSFDGPFTIFAPTDKAFSKLPKEFLDDLFDNKEKLTEVLTCHIILDKVMAKDVAKIKKVKTVNGKELSIKIGKGVKVDNANIIKTDIECSNGVIHIIDKVLLLN